MVLRWLKCPMNDVGVFANAGAVIASPDPVRAAAATTAAAVRWILNMITLPTEEKPV
jgi:hypothetical protein